MVEKENEAIMFLLETIQSNLKTGFEDIKKITNKQWEHINKNTIDIVCLNKEVTGNKNGSPGLVKKNEKLKKDINELEKKVEENERWIEKIETTARTTKIIFSTIGAVICIIITFVLKFIK